MNSKTEKVKTRTFYICQFFFLTVASPFVSSISTCIWIKNKKSDALIRPLLDINSPVPTILQKINSSLLLLSSVFDQSEKKGSSISNGGGVSLSLSFVSEFEGDRYIVCFAKSIKFWELREERKLKA